MGRRVLAIEKCPYQKKTLRWKPKSEIENGRRESTKEWVNRTFYSNSNSNKSDKKSDFLAAPEDEDPNPNPSSEKALMSNENQKQREVPSNALNGKISAYEGEPAIYFEKSDIVANAEKFKFCLVGKFPRSWPSLVQIREWVSREWKLKGEWSVTLLDARHVFFRLENEPDMLRIWMRRRWFICGHLMRVFKWTADFRPAEGEPCSSPVWIGLPSLPVVFFQEDLLVPIASLVGSVIAIDRPTRTLSRTDVARICVEVDLSRELPGRVWIGIEEGDGFWQDICYEKLPSYCLKCRQQGHSTTICRFNTSNSVKEDSLDKEKNSGLQSQVTEIPQTVNKGNNKMLKARERDVVDTKTLIEEVEIQHANSEKLQETKKDSQNSMECKTEAGFPVTFQSSSVCKVTEFSSIRKMDGHSQEDCRTSNAFSRNYDRKGSQAKLAQNSTECTTKAGFPVKFPYSTVYRVSKFSNNWKMNGHSEQDCRTSDTFGRNYGRKSRHAELAQIIIGPSIQDECGKNQCSLGISSHLPLSTDTRAKATNRSSGNKNEIESKKKNEATESSKEGLSLPPDELMQSASHSCHRAEQRPHTGIGLSSEEWMTTGSSKTPTKHTVNEGNGMGFGKNEIEHVLEIRTEKVSPQACKSISKSGGDSEFGSLQTLPKKEEKNQEAKTPVRRKLSSEKSIFFWNKKTKRKQNLEAFLKNYRALGPKRYKYSDIKNMTDSFRHKVGQGGFGAVFKGMLPDGCPVAVKVLNNESNKDTLEEVFINEIACVGTIYHVNIITLLGFCSEGSNCVLIYEYMPSGSLAEFIYKKTMSTTHSLGWEKLCQIAVGIARGLEYLHFWCNTQILHLDIKPTNILLDENFCPKIADFGLAKLCPMREVISITAARGTIGYIAPEVYNKNLGQVSYKSDVYSYGMMMLEMVGGRRNIDCSAEHSSQIYHPDWVYKHLNRQGDMGVGRFSGTVEEETARKMILVGLWCIQIDPEKRPSMSRVVQMLEGSIACLEIPPDPFPVKEASYLNSDTTFS